MKSSDITGKEFKLWRLSKGWQKTWLADRLGVSPAYIHKNEEDSARVPIILILAVSALAADIPLIKPLTESNSQ